MILTRLSILLIMILLAVNVQAGEDDIVVITEENAPFNFSVNGTATGIATDIFLQMASTAKLDIKREDILIMPWARGYQEVQKKPNVILYAMARIKSREKLFQWIGPIMPLKSCMLALKQSDMHITDIAIAAGQYRFGTVRDSGSEQHLIRLGANPKWLQRVHDQKLNIKKLIDGRIDAVLGLEANMLYIIKEMGLDPDDFKDIYTPFSTQLYFAASREMNPAFVYRLQNALDAMKVDGSLNTIIRSYLH